MNPFLAMVIGLLCVVIALDYDTGRNKVCEEAMQYKADIRLLTCESYYKEHEHDSNQAD